VRTALLVAYHFPPLAGSSGLQRTLRFAQYLPEFGWKPVVLSVEFSAYERVDEASLDLIPAGCTVVRTRCLDAARHLSLFGRYPAFAAIPDRWASWRLWGVRAGCRLAREHGASVVWSTYPIATAHQIGAAISRRTGLPWVADFRDPMAQEGYPADPRRWQAFKRIEETAAQRAARMVFVSPSAVDMYRERYPATPAERFALIENGYDESSFDGLDAPEPTSAGAPLVLLHSGIVYPSERDPAALFVALGRLRERGAIRPGEFVIRFRAAVHDALLRELAERHRVAEFVDIAPAIPYRGALREMLGASALVVMQGDNCNGQIPAKLYEYLRAGRPILGLADPAGDTGRTLTSLGYPLVTKLESAADIERNLPAFVARLREGTLPMASREVFERYSRRTLTGRLAELLDTVAAD
jgi:glycosyltransferase involved in cell wall biosynthesis